MYDTIVDMSRAERRQQPDLDIDALLQEQAVTAAKARENLNKDVLSKVPFKPVSALEIRKFTDKVRFHPQGEGLGEKLNDLKQNALKLVLIGENGKLVQKGSEHFPESRSLVSRAYDVKRLNNELETIEYRNDILSHVLSTKPDTLSGNLQIETKIAQKRFSLIKEAFAQLPKPPSQPESEE
jgi:hypothetical protein